MCDNLIMMWWYGSLVEATEAFTEDFAAFVIFVGKVDELLVNYDCII